jgi:hypothetical protein
MTVLFTINGCFTSGSLTILLWQVFQLHLGIFAYYFLHDLYCNITCRTKYLLGAGVWPSHPKNFWSVARRFIRLKNSEIPWRGWQSRKVVDTVLSPLCGIFYRCLASLTHNFNTRLCWNSPNRQFSLSLTKCFRNFGEEKLWSWVISVPPIIFRENCPAIMSSDTGGHYCSFSNWLALVSCFRCFSWLASSVYTALVLFRTRNY